MQRLVIIGISIGILATAGVIEVVLAQRRSNPLVAERIQLALDQLPLEVGDWKGRTAEFNPLAIKQTNAIAHTYRIYTREQSKESVELLLLAGDPGEVGTHDPERCYGGAGFNPVGTRRRMEFVDPVTAATSSYWLARFEADTFPSTSLQVIWAWSTDGTWVASDDARFEFLGQSVLYKLYVTRRLPTHTVTPNSDPTEPFLQELLPRLRLVLSSASR